MRGGGANVVRVLQERLDKENDGQQARLRYGFSRIERPHGTSRWPLRIGKREDITSMK